MVRDLILSIAMAIVATILLPSGTEILDGRYHTASIYSSVEKSRRGMFIYSKTKKLTTHAKVGAIWRASIPRKNIMRRETSRQYRRPDMY